jgi:hypothetical protein
MYLKVVKTVRIEMVTKYMGNSPIRRRHHAQIEIKASPVLLEVKKVVGSNYHKIVTCFFLILRSALSLIYVQNALKPVRYARKKPATMAK